MLGALTWLTTYKQSKRGEVESLCGLDTDGMHPTHVKTKMRHDMESFSGTNELPSSYTQATPELHCFCLRGLTTFGCVLRVRERGRRPIKAAYAKMTSTMGRANTQQTRSGSKALSKQGWCCIRISGSHHQGQGQMICIVPRSFGVFGGTEGAPIWRRRPGPWSCLWPSQSRRLECLQARPV